MRFAGDHLRIPQGRGGHSGAGGAIGGRDTAVPAHHELLGTRFDNLKSYESYAAHAAAVRESLRIFTHSFYGSHRWGTPRQVITRASELDEAFGCDELMFVFRYGSMSMAQAEKSMRLFARGVMPAPRALDPGAMQAPQMA